MVTLCMMPHAGQITKEIRDDGLKSFKGFKTQCEPLGMDATLASLDRLIALMSREAVTYADVSHDLEDLQGRIRDELAMKVVWCVDSHQYRLIQESHLWGEEVGHSFPSAAHDLEEAGKCLALDRSTACVFHLMRIMELGLRLLSESLNDPRLDPKRNPSWDTILKKCREELDKPLHERAPEWRADEPFFSGAAARLLAVKDAWRNPTMHVGNSKYTEGEALDVFNHVAAFMRHLATKLKEEPATDASASPT